jgi:LytS/YehU family sensor histidine kinase
MQLEPHSCSIPSTRLRRSWNSTEGKQAIQTLERLNAILHRTLGENKPAKVRVAQELELMEDYLTLEQTRFADRLHVNLSIDPAALGGMVPCFLLRPLIENAVRHGISRSEEGETILVTVERREARLQLKVRDSGPGTNEQAQNGHGIGLKNTRERLSHLYGEQFDFRAGALPGGGYEVTVELPYERGSTRLSAP